MAWFELIFKPHLCEVSAKPCETPIETYIQLTGVTMQSHVINWLCRSPRFTPVSISYTQHTDGSMTLKADGFDDVPKEGSVSQTLVPNGQPMLRLLLLLLLFLILSQRRLLVFTLRYVATCVWVMLMDNRLGSNNWARHWCLMVNHC